MIVEEGHDGQNVEIVLAGGGACRRIGGIGVEHLDGEGEGLAKQG